VTEDNLKWHIEKFPSDFDLTSIAKQLVDDNVSVRTYADVRDILWRRLRMGPISKGLSTMKARLEFEMPESCNVCLFAQREVYWSKILCSAVCLVNKKSWPREITTTLKPEWCPLQPVLTVGDYLKGEE
jgi:hypothetical protein